MGRITIFTINGCPFCIKAKKALQKRSIPYMEINIQTHPDKRNDLLTLSDSLSVPQIFFNELHIGGSEELIALLETEWDNTSAGDIDADDSNSNHYLEKYEREIGSLPDPTDERLHPSTKDPVQEVIIKPNRNSKDYIQLPSSTTNTNDNDGKSTSTNTSTMSILEMTNRLLNTTPYTNILYRGRSLKNCITGYNFTLFLMKEFEMYIGSTNDAIAFGQHLLQKNIITHAIAHSIESKEKEKFRNKKNVFYRLQPHQKPNVLNSFRIWNPDNSTSSSANALAIVARTSKLLQKIIDRTIDEDGNTNFKSITTTHYKEDEHDDNDNNNLHEQYNQFQEEICELQSVQMDNMDLNTKKAFVINTYNLMIKYAQIKVGIPSTNLQRSSFFTSVLINIGNDLFSFNDLENGILRSNAYPPYAFHKVFTGDDVRKKLIVKKEDVDPRIHFSLNCGANSCPPVKKFTSLNLEDELRIVALAFCEQDGNIKIDEKANTLYCNTIFKWYMVDFTKSKSVNDLPNALIKYLKGDRKDTLQRMIESNKNKKNIHVEFNVYDWGSGNISQSNSFSKSNLKADEYSLKSLLCLES
jgi:glutaredoxin